MRISTVGPATKRNRASATASTMFVLDSHWMPFATPDTADTTNASVSNAMIMMSSPMPASPRPASLTPLPICSAPRPSEAAEPNSVARMASTSITLPAPPFACRAPISGVNTALIVCRRPRRKVPYAMARPTTA
ncbi:hypothetical protein GCM10020001_040370 [Nonomuraea salmonea]